MRRKTTGPEDNGYGDLVYCANLDEKISARTLELLENPPFAPAPPCDHPAIRFNGLSWRCLRCREILHLP